MPTPRRRTRPPESVPLPGDEGVTLVRAADVPADEFYAAIDASRAHLEPWMVWARGYVPRQADEFVVHVQQAWDSGQEFTYALVDEDGTVTGAVGLHRRIGEGGLEVGYWVRADRVRRGLATRAAAAVTDAAFALDGVDHVEIHHDEANEPSGRVPARLGFTEVARAPKEPEAPGCVGVEVVWRVTRGDWHAARRHAPADAGAGIAAGGPVPSAGDR
jgi:ribosomal-protein-serine acetyltransferase